MSRTPMQRDFGEVRTLARELLEQYRHYSRITATGNDDDLRALVVHDYATRLNRVANRMVKRWEKARAEREQAGGKRGTE